MSQDEQRGIFRQRGKCVQEEKSAGFFTHKPAKILLVESDLDMVDIIVRHFSRHGLEVIVAETLTTTRELLRRGQLRLDAAVIEDMLSDGSGTSLLPELELLLRQPTVIILRDRVCELEPHALEYRPIVVTKPVSPNALLRTVRAALSGYSLPLIRRFARASALSRREIEAVILVAQGLKPKEIADRMNCSEPTIYSHLSNICDKTGCSHYLGIVAKLFAFACHALGHTPPDLRALADGAEASEGHRPEDCSS